MARLLDRLGVPIDLAIAENLYAGLATDTGHFRHADSDAHRLAARLIDTGVRPAELLRPITDSHPFGWLTMLSQVLGGAVLHPQAAGGRGVVCTTIDLETSAGLRSEELDSVIDILRTVQEAAVAVVLKQTGPDDLAGVPAVAPARRRRRAGHRAGRGRARQGRRVHPPRRSGRRRRRDPGHPGPLRPGGAAPRWCRGPVVDRAGRLCHAA